MLLKRSETYESVRSTAETGGNSHTKDRNPYATLKELGQMINPPISKSGVNYRLQQLIKISKSLG